MEEGLDTPRAKFGSITDYLGHPEKWRELPAAIRSRLMGTALTTISQVNRDLTNRLDKQRDQSLKA
jgi:hypothetical protein